MYIPANYTLSNTHTKNLPHIDYIFLQHYMFKYSVQSNPSTQCVCSGRARPDVVRQRGEGHLSMRELTHLFSVWSAARP